MDVAVIGGGVAGLTACLYLARAGVHPHHYVGEEDQGGLLTKTSIVENFPGFPNGIPGYALIENMEEQCGHYPMTTYQTKVIDVRRLEEGFAVHDSDGNETRYTTIIIATGSTPRRLGLEGEDMLWANGISSCAVCDGSLYRDKRIVVVGGGDTACEEALFLTRFSNVTLIHRRDKLRASAIMSKRVLNHPKITVVWNAVIVELIEGVLCNDDVCKPILTGIVVENVITTERKEMLVDGLFYGLGLVPNSKNFTNIVSIDCDGFIIKSPDSSRASPGVFVAGDVADRKYKQAITAAGSGCMAALDAIEYLESRNDE